MKPILPQAHWHKQELSSHRILTMLQQNDVEQNDIIQRPAEEA